jgi:hypothetical protein
MRASLRSGEAGHVCENDYSESAVAVLATAARLPHQAKDLDAIIIEISKDKV